MSSSSSRPRIRLLPLLLLASLASAHEHHEDNIPDGDGVSPDPIDSILWWHICAMITSFGIIFPIGMVLGIVRNRWHVPLQAVGTVVAVMGWFLGHGHKGRQFAGNIHASFASSLMSMLMIQIGIGAYLKLHLETRNPSGIHAKARRFVVLLHGIVGKAMPFVAWVQMLFGGITALGFCRGDHLGQCLAHFIMGSAFIAYGIIMTLMMMVGQAWLRRSGKSQEFFDSSVITAWGIVNTFTEHRWGTAWVHNDVQHTTMGVVWWCAGLLGLWLARNRRRNLIPGMVLFLTGWAMAGHPQHLMLSTMVHKAFGYTLMGAGVTRMVEIAFVLKDGPAYGEPSSFQHLPPYLLFASGFMFMSATEEQMALVDSVGIDHVSYLLVIYSMAFLMYLFVQVCLSVFMANPKPEPQKDLEAPPRTNGIARPEVVADRQLRDAEEFELAGLMSDEEEPETPRVMQRASGEMKGR